VLFLFSVETAYFSGLEKFEGMKKEVKEELIQPVPLPVNNPP
jgi:hypothetical protein